MMLRQKQETFCLNIVKGMSQREAYIGAGYSSKSSIATIDAHASRLASSGKVSTRVDELRAEIKSELIADEIERRERLSVFVREDNYSKFGINRQGNIQATDLLNKMDKLYSDSPTVNVDARTLTINVISDKARDLTERLIEGERTDGTKQEEE